MPGQEEGNVTYVVEKGAGVWASDADQVVETLRSWLADPALLSQVALNSKSLGRPDASNRIATAIARRVGIVQPG
jgi:1,2-diacylglycerol 3-beta-galactosyltransferase